jgi:hypothetical protein
MASTISSASAAFRRGLDTEVLLGRGRREFFFFRVSLLFFNVFLRA